MLSIKEKIWTKSILERQHEQQILNFIADEKVVTFEILIEEFPWIGWNELFSILARFSRDGLMTVHQIGSIWEMRIKEEFCGVV